MKNVTIVIPTYNRPDTLRLVLDSYYAQKCLASIVIIDDCSSLSYLNVINEFRNKYPSVDLVYLKNERNLGAGASRNIGLAQVKTKYVLWGEDDAFLREDYIEKLMERQDGYTIAFGGIYYGIMPSDSEIDKERIIIQQQEVDKPIFDFSTLEGYYRKKIDGDIEVPWGHALLLAPINAYSGIRYFEGYKVNGYREETDAQVKMIENGFRILYCSNTECYHFPAINKNGGQHTSNMLKSDIYKLINNGLFLKRNLSILKRHFPIKGSITHYQFKFAVFIIKGHLRGVERRLSKLWKEK